MANIGVPENDTPDRLFRALAEQLKVPLLQIARASELARLTGVNSAHSDNEYVADMALRLIDSYLLGVELQGLPTLELEPVSLSAVLQDAATKLSTLAKQHDCELELHLGGKYGPVMAHRRSLEAAYVSLGYAFIESQPVSEKKHTVLLGAHRSARGLVAGVFGEQPELTSDMYRRAQALYGQAPQAIPAVSSSNGAGIFIADNLLRSMETPLRVARYHKLSGLAATLLPSKQLSLV